MKYNKLLELMERGGFLFFWAFKPIFMFVNFFKKRSMKD